MTDIQYLSTAIELRSANTPETTPLPSEFRIFRAGLNTTQNGDFKFDATAAKAVLAAAKKWGVDYMIDLEHMALYRADSDARGWFQLAVRNGELWATGVSWTADGERRLRSRTQRYISPAFMVDADQRVTELLNVAIVSMPATHQAVPLVASRKRPSDVATPPLTIRLPAAQRAALERQAEAQGVALSTLARDALLAGLSEIEIATVANVTDLAHLERYAAARRARAAQLAAQATPIPIGADGLNEIQRATVEAIKDPAHRERVATRLRALNNERAARRK